MLNRPLLLCPLVLLLFSCSDNTSDNQPNSSLPDTCLLTSIQYDSLFARTIIYDTTSFLPSKVIIGNIPREKFTYSGNKYTVTNFGYSESDTTSITIFTVDSNKKVTSFTTKRNEINGLVSLTNYTCRYNLNSTINTINSIGYIQNTDGSQSLISSLEERFGWINGNLTSDSTFFVSNPGTPQEIKSFLRIKRWEYTDNLDIKGLAGLYYDFYRIPNLFGKGSRNLVSKVIEDPKFTTANQTEFTYLFNNLGWPIADYYSGQFSGKRTYSYTCYKRK